MRGGAGGILLLLIGSLVLIGFLTGNLDRWVGYLFDPNRPPLGEPAPKGKAPAGGPATPAPVSSQLVTLGQATARRTA